MDNPKYVVSGAWADKEWQEVAARHGQIAENTPDYQTYAAGPRLHPWGELAFSVVVDGEPRIYPTEQHARDDGAFNQPKDEPKEETAPDQPPAEAPMLAPPPVAKRR